MFSIIGIVILTIVLTVIIIIFIGNNDDGEKDVILSDNDKQVSFLKNGLRVGSEFFIRSSQSANGKYVVSARDQYFENSRRIAGCCVLVDTETKEVLFNVQVTRANNPHVTDDGFVILENWLGEGLSGALVAFDKFGEKKWEKKFKANIGESELSENQNFVTVKTYHSNYEPHSNRKFLISVRDGTVVWKSDDYGEIVFVNGECCIQLEKLNGEKEKFKFDDNWKLPNDYYSAVKQIEIDEEGGIFYVIFAQIKKALKKEPPDIAKVKRLISELDKQDYDAEPKDEAKYLRIKGEIAEKEGNLKKAIEHWDKAIELYPKIGVKNMLNAAKIKLGIVINEINDMK